MIMKEMGRVMIDGEEVILVRTQYDNNRIAIKGVTDRDGLIQPFAMLTVDIPDVPLANDEVIVKNWSENAEFAQVCLDSGLFEDTMTRIKIGYVLAPIWRIK